MTLPGQPFWVRRYAQLRAQGFDDHTATVRARSEYPSERVDFTGLNRAAAQEMQRRQMRAYGDSLARAQPLTAQDFADVVGEQVARDEYELGSGGPWVEIRRERYPSERWERIPVDRVRYPGLADTRRVRRFHFETPAYRRQFRNVNWAVAAALIVVPAVSMLLSGEPLHMLAALIIGWSQALIGAVRMAVFSLRRRHTA